MTMTRVRMSTILGDMILELDAENAPKTVENFVKLCELRLLRWHYFSPGH